MVGAIADTHAVIWYLLDSPRLSNRAAAEFERSQTSAMLIGVSSMTVSAMGSAQDGRSRRHGTPGTRRREGDEGREARSTRRPVAAATLLYACVLNVFRSLRDSVV